MQKRQVILTRKELKVLESHNGEIWFILKLNDITLFVTDGEKL